MPKGKTAAQMVNIRSRRGPFSDPRDGRLLRGIRYAASGKDVEVLTTSQLLEWSDRPCSGSGASGQGAERTDWKARSLERVDRSLDPLSFPPVRKMRKQMM